MPKMICAECELCVSAQKNTADSHEEAHGDGYKNHFIAQLLAESAIVVDKAFFTTAKRRKCCLHYHGGKKMCESDLQRIIFLRKSCAEEMLNGS
jgi:hypothetical protein